MFYCLLFRILRHNVQWDMLDSWKRLHTHIISNFQPCRVSGEGRCPAAVRGLPCPSSTQDLLSQDCGVSPEHFSCYHLNSYFMAIIDEQIAPLGSTYRWEINKRTFNMIQTDLMLRDLMSAARVNPSSPPILGKKWLNDRMGPSIMSVTLFSVFSMAGNYPPASCIFSQVMNLAGYGGETESAISTGYPALRLSFPLLCRSRSLLLQILPGETQIKGSLAERQRSGGQLH